MPESDAVAVAIWVVGLLLVLAGVLMVIARLALRRHTGRFEMPWRRGIAPLVAGLALLTASLYLLGVRDGLVDVWLVLTAIAVVVLVVYRFRRR